jgi:hypothetical protein
VTELSAEPPARFHSCLLSISSVLVPYKTRQRLKQDEKKPPFFAGRGYFNTFEGIPCSSPLNGSESETERWGEKRNSSSVKDGWSQEI